MSDIKKYVMQGLVGAGFLVLSWWVGTIWQTTNLNTKYSIEHGQNIKAMNSRITNIEYKISDINSNYVTRRELDIRLQNLDTKIHNIDKTLEKLDVKLDKIVDKITE